MRSRAPVCSSHPAETDQDGKAVRELDQVIGEALERGLRRVDPFAGVHADEDHEDRDERDGDDDRDGAGDVGEQDARFRPRAG